MSAASFVVRGLSFQAPSSSISADARRRLSAEKYELEEIRAAESLLDADLPLVELGAGIGVVSCVANQLLACRGDHVALEPDPVAFSTLKVNRRINQSRFTPLLGALGYQGSPRSSAVTAPPTTWDPSNTYVLPNVATWSLEQVATTYFGDRAINLIVDIEGAERHLLENEANFLAARVQTLIVELHPQTLGRDGAAQVLRQVMNCGLRLESLSHHTVYGFVRDKAAQA